MSDVKVGALDILGTLDLGKVQEKIAVLYNETFSQQLKEHFKPGAAVYSQIQGTVGALLVEEARSLVKEFLRENKGFQALISQTIEKAVEAKAKQSMEKLIASTAGSAYNGAVILTQIEQTVILGALSQIPDLNEKELALQKKLRG